LSVGSRISDAIRRFIGRLADSANAAPADAAQEKTPLVERPHVISTLKISDEKMRMAFGNRPSLHIGQNQREARKH
jgi:hypothetical protein